MEFLNDTLIRDILTSDALAQKAGTVAVPHADTLPPELDGKAHSMAIAVINRTQFTLYPRSLTYLEDSTEFASWGGVLEPFSVLTISVYSHYQGPDDFIDNTLNSIAADLTGVGGGICSDDFYIDNVYLGGTFQIGFDNPLVGSAKACVITNSGANDAYQHVDDQPTYASLGPYQGTDTNGEPVTLWLNFQCFPGPYTFVNIGQSDQAQVVPTDDKLGAGPFPQRPIP